MFRLTSDRGKAAANEALAKVVGRATTHAFVDVLDIIYYADDYLSRIPISATAAVGIGLEFVSGSTLPNCYRGTPIRTVARVRRVRNGWVLERVDRCEIFNVPNPVINLEDRHRGAILRGVAKQAGVSIAVVTSDAVAA